MLIVEPDKTTCFSCQPDGYVANVAANVEDFLLLKPVVFQVLETPILNLPWVPEDNDLIFTSFGVLVKMILGTCIHSIGCNFQIGTFHSFP